ncbi:hypothetical protein AB0758_49635 [Tolypothrix bouteillei VB521301_2]
MTRIVLLPNNSDRQIPDGSTLISLAGIIAGTWFHSFNSFPSDWQ